jgi:XXXCH domain-containing protein
MPEKKADRKIKLEMAMAEAADWLRELADQLETASHAPADDALPELADFSKLKIGFKRIGDRVKVKAKVKGGPSPAESTSAPEAPAGGPPETPAPSDGEKAYKSLKKSMKQHFKTIQERLEAGGLPPADTVAAFLSESDRMIRFPGFGDEYYEAYRAACFRFREAHRTGDIAACKTVCDELDRLKSDCHDRYK